MADHTDFEIRDVRAHLHGVGPRLEGMQVRKALQHGSNLLHRGLRGAPRMSSGSGVSFAYEGYLRLSEASEFHCEFNPESTEAKAQFRTSLRKLNNEVFGSFDFSDCYVFGNQGLILDAQRRICWIGVALGWEQQHLDGFICEPGLGQRVAIDTLRVPNTLLRSMDKASVGRRAQSCEVLPMPGFRVYGHWLIDLLPRLAHAARSVGEHRVLCTSRLAPWGRSLAEAFGLRTDTHEPALSLGTGARWESAIAATTIRSVRVLDGRLARKHWMTLKRALANDGRTARGRKRLYISRSRLATDRRFANAEEIESFFRMRGWEVVFPESLPLSDQVALFAAAEIIVGDDGSGLHNCIFAPRGTPMLVLNFNRINLFHATLAQAMGHRLAFLDSTHASSESGARYHIDTQRLEEAVADLSRGRL